jgi:hypothetical protein
VWTLKRSPLAEEQRKLGMSAIEFVSGKVDGIAGTMTLNGTRKDDPHDVIFTDRYRLVAGENGRSLAGVSGQSRRLGRPGVPAALISPSPWPGDRRAAAGWRASPIRCL